MSVEQYSSIEELIEKEEEAGRNPADYCFDEEWLKWICEIQHGSDEAKKACLCLELTSSKYCSDSGPVQMSMYEMLFKPYGIRESKKRFVGEGKAFFSMDILTNYIFILNLALAILEDTPRSKSPTNSFSQDYPRHRYYSGTLCRNGFSLLEDVLEDSSDEAFLESMKRFARCSSCLGNYSCMPMSLAREARLNSMKSGGLYVFDDAVSVNDQFALFAKWIEEYCEGGLSDIDKSIIENWKKAMLFDEELWDSYTAAASEYKKIFDFEKKEQRIMQFAKYLDLVSEAIEIRSERIIKTIKGLNKS